MVEKRRRGCTTQDNGEDYDTIDGPIQKTREHEEMENVACERPLMDEAY